MTEKRLQKEAPDRALESLPERDRRVLELRYGLRGEEPRHTLEHIGRRLGITRERVRQIEIESPAPSVAARDRGRRYPLGPPGPSCRRARRRSGRACASRWASSRNGGLDAVRGDEVGEALSAGASRPPLVDAVGAEEARRVHLDQPPSLAGALPPRPGAPLHVLGALGVRDDRGQPGGCHVLSETLSELEGAVEGHLHENGGQVAGAGSAAGLRRAGARSGSGLPAEPEIEPAPGESRRHLGACRPNRLLPLPRQRQGRPDAASHRERVSCRAASRQSASPASTDRAPSSPEGNDVGMDVDERGHASTLKAAKQAAAIRRGGRGGARRDRLELAQRPGLELADAPGGRRRGQPPTSSRVFGIWPFSSKRRTSTWRIRSLSEASAS